MESPSCEWFGALLGVYVNGLKQPATHLYSQRMHVLTIVKNK